MEGRVHKVKLRTVRYDAPVEGETHITDESVHLRETQSLLGETEDQGKMLKDIIWGSHRVLRSLETSYLPPIPFFIRANVVLSGQRVVTPALPGSSR